MGVTRPPCIHRASLMPNSTVALPSETKHHNTPASNRHSMQLHIKNTGNKLDPLASHSYCSDAVCCSMLAQMPYISMTLKQPCKINCLHVHAVLCIPIYGCMWCAERLSQKRDHNPSRSACHTGCNSCASSQMTSKCRHGQMTLPIDAKSYWELSLAAFMAS